MADTFTWKNGARAAVSLTFDDARVSQIDYGLSVFRSFDARATFYVSLANLDSRPEGWEIAIDNGHEIGNHTFSHPCSGNFQFGKDKALEDFTLERMSAELEQADTAIEGILGVKPTTFAYPCGQTFVGRGVDTRSYVPLVANRFVAGRGFNNETDNDPLRCDLAQLNSTASDGQTAEPLIRLIASAVENGSWLIFAGHEIENPKSHQNTMAGALRAVLAYIRQNSADIWLDTVAEIALYIATERGEEIPQEKEE